MKRPPGLWFLLSAGVLCMSLQLAFGVRATSLIFAKTTTTTTSTTEGNSLNNTSSDETVTESGAETSNVTKPTLTGNPQLDYIWDPNLPKVLNGYNLSEYPFYERVPDEVIEFKCDGLHDGFYASIVHKCQVYHHCLFGTRYDFLCANYTAFDQKTFICQFVSEVDCVNSKKYWHRNDALYQAASTTTIKPNYALYTLPPSRQQHPSSAGGADGGGGDQTAPKPPRRPPSGPGRRNPPRRQRPDYYDYEEDYEDDYYYEERPRNRWRNKRPRPRPRRPVYEDDYEEEEDDRYDRRAVGRRDRERPRRRMKDRRKHEDSEEDYEDDKRPSDRRSQKRRPSEDYPEDSEEDRRRSRPKNRRPAAAEDDYEDAKEKDEKTADKSTGGSIYDRPRTASRIKPPVPKSESGKFASKPSGKSSTTAKSAPEDDYYDDYEDEPPKTSKPQRKPEGGESRRRDEERDTGRKQLSSSASRLRPQRDEIDDPEEDTKRRPSTTIKERPKFAGHRERMRPTPTPKKTTTTTTEEYYDEYEDDLSKDRKIMSSRGERFRPKLASTTTSTTTTTPKPTSSTRSTTTTRPTTTTTTTTSKPSSTTSIKDLMREPLVRIVKRPFLPSRGGSPYSPRGLQPVGTKALTENPLEIDQEEEAKLESTQIDDISDKPFKPSPVIIKMPPRQKFVSIADIEQDDDFKPVSNRPQTPITRPNLKPKDYNGPRTTQRPKVEEISDPLDIDEYDVTLNDALNPTLPNLPVRGYPAGFGSDYNTYSAFQRPRYVVEPAVNPSNQEYTYQQQPPREHYDTTVAKTYSNSGQDFVNSDAKYKGQYSTISSNGQNYRPRGTHTYYIQQK